MNRIYGHTTYLINNLFSPKGDDAKLCIQTTTSISPVISADAVAAIYYILHKSSDGH